MGQLCVQLMMALTERSFTIRAFIPANCITAVVTETEPGVDIGD